MTKDAQSVIFFFIQFRNMSTLAVSVFYCLRMVIKPHLAYNCDIVTHTALYEFDTMMLSVVPYKYFKKFIIKEYPDDFIYLRMYAITTELKVLQMQQENGTRPSKD